jgi:hypothetical protein
MLRMHARGQAPELYNCPRHKDTTSKPMSGQAQACLLDCGGTGHAAFAWSMAKYLECTIARAAITSSHGSSLVGKPGRL